MAYAPKKQRYKIRWKFAIPLFILIALLLYTMVSILLPKKEEEKKFTVCGFDEKKTVEVLNKKVAQTYAVSDYTYYGESLGLYTSTYNGENEDAISGKTIQIQNMCSNETISFTMDADVDQKITLSDLEPGFYELSIIDNLVEKRLVYNDTFKGDPFYTVKRNNKVKKATLVADKNLLKDYNITWKESYLFLNVQETKPHSGDIDVYIDPYGMNTDLQYVADKGNIGNGLSEYAEMYDAALLIKKQLETYGLRVEVSRNSQDGEAKKAYGADGRLAQGYKKHAKYYMSLRFNKHENTSFRGLEVWHSAHASDALSNNIVFGLQKNLGMVTSTYINNEGTGVGASAVVKGYFDNILYLRETGGKATFAAMYSATSEEENASFKNAYGMNAMEIDLGYVSNAEDAQYWKDNKDKIAKQIAQSFAQGIGVIEK